MDTFSLLFYLFALVLVYAGFRVITARSPVTAALHLVLAFFSASCVWMLLQAEFLSIALVLVYVGAVMVLFLFVVMMLDIDVEPLRAGFARYLPFGLLVAVVMLLEILTLIGIKAQVALPFGPEPEGSNVQWIARRLFTEFLLPFETAAVILTVAVIAAVMLTLRRRPGAKRQDPGEQARVRAEDRIRMIKMDPVRPTPRTAPIEAGQTEIKP